MQLELASEIDFDGWRRQARWLASAQFLSAISTGGSTVK